MRNLIEFVWSIVKAVFFVIGGLIMMAGVVVTAVLWIARFLGEMFFIGAKAKFTEEMAKGQEDHHNKQ